MGNKPSHAEYFVNDVSDVHAILENLGNIVNDGMIVH